MGAARFVWEDWGPLEHLELAKSSMHPTLQESKVESAVQFAIDISKELGYEIVRWREEVLSELAASAWEGCVCVPGSHRRVRGMAGVVQTRGSHGIPGH